MTQASISDAPAKLLCMEEFLSNSFHVFRRASDKAALGRLKVH
ncbi:hypothetical protein [Anaerotruncus colihominis]|nr:hypothetical protein [Anaerotruncus colihominis]